MLVEKSSPLRRWWLPKPTSCQRKLAEMDAMSITIRTCRRQNPWQVQLACYLSSYSMVKESMAALPLQMGLDYLSKLPLDMSHCT